MSGYPQVWVRAGITISLRIDLPQGRVGPGKIALLEAIARTGSISAGGRAPGMSYKRAWDLVADVNRTLGTSCVAAIAGGQGGGGAQLTDAGRDLIADYRAIERASRRAAERRLTPRSKDLAKPCAHRGDSEDGDEPR
jgi:molybdate transport system regulatory protein